MESDIKLDKIDAGENYEEHPQDDDIEEIGKHVTDLCEALVPDNSRFSKERFLDILLYFIEDDKRILYSQVTNFIFGSYKKSESLKKLSTADLAFFAEGWQDARGCRIEFASAIAYGIEFMIQYD